MSKLFALMLPAVALGFFAPAAAPPRASTARFNFQPNRDYNAFGAADSLSREERSQRFANAGDREVTLQKPLGVVLEQDAQKNVYVASIDAGGNADLSVKVRQGNQVTLVLEGKAAMQKKVGGIFNREKKQAETDWEARERLRDEVLAERGQAAKGWFGIF